MKNTIIAITIGVATAALVSCKNPADKTADAEVRDALPEVAVGEGLVYTFTENSTIEFTGSKVTGSHSGGFKEFTGSVVLNGGTPVSGEFTIQMDSTWSDAEKLTEHLKSPDFFDVGQFPESRFQATSFEELPDLSWKISGNLTLHGVTKNITIPATIDAGSDLVKVTSEFDINRKDFGIVYPGKPDDLIRDEVVIRLVLETVPKS